VTADFRDSPPFPKAAPRYVSDPQLRANLRRATTTIRAKRDRLVEELPDFEQLRDAAAAIKDDALSRLDQLLEQVERSVTSAGGHVHFAAGAAEANETVVRLVEATGAEEVVKVKSMTTGETRLNEALARAGTDVAETDLAELIVQLGDDLPSHIVVPAIHRNRAEVREIFRAHMGERGLPAPSDLSDDPVALAGAARAHLRQRFLRAKVAISGGNFVIAETGSVVVVESEGNGRMCLTLPETLISVVGIDKVIPRYADLEVFLQLLARSATGERMNPYTSMWSGVTPGDGPREFHLVLLDNGRSSALADRVGRQALRCIRCAACLNVCPVYERVGGHAYGSVYPGPIGAVLTPQLHGVATDAVTAALPYASTLCGACLEACPVRIDIPRLLVNLRARTVDQALQKGTSVEAVTMAAAGVVLASPVRMARAERFAGRVVAPLFRRGRVGPLPGPLSRWTSARDAPVPARQSFRQWWADEHEPVRRPPATLAPPEAAVPGGGGAPGMGLGHLLRALWPWPRRRPAGAPRPAELPSGREAVLGAVRTALKGAPYPPARVARAYRGEGQSGVAEPLALFVSRLAEYRAEAHVVSPAELGATISTVLGGRRPLRVVVPPDLPESWLPMTGGLECRRDDGYLSASQLDLFDAAITGCAVAIAATGTIVLDGGLAQGRRALSLVPDHLVVVVHADQVVGGVPDAVARLRPAAPQTWISGPSATSDIELNRVEGVHGPRRLDVVIVSGAPPGAPADGHP
jgi:iron-sulfur cluster protein